MKPVPMIPIFIFVIVIASRPVRRLFQGMDLDVCDRSGRQLPVEDADGFAGHMLFPYLTGGPFLDEDVDALLVEVSMEMIGEAPLLGPCGDRQFRRICLECVFLAGRDHDRATTLMLLVICLSCQAGSRLRYGQRPSRCMLG
ncbi:hypothetical protein T190_31425 [Sinorhizobium meliloti CCBAU 01290]|nr:hypothetical protein T190_31425 [Sinorhizobium meliloti CCBAU 01290]